MTRAEMFDRMSSAEFADWIAWDELYPIGARRFDVQIAQLCAVIKSGFTGKRAGVAQFDLFSDARFTAPKPGRPIADQKRHAIRITRMLGGTVTLRKKPA